MLPVLAALAMGCSAGGAAAVPTSTPSSTASAVAAPPEAGGFPSKRLGVVLHLTDGTAWHIDDTRSPWLLASEPSTNSTLVLRTWRDENRMTRARCEDRARGWRKLPSRDGATILQHGTLDQPVGFDTAYDVGLVADPAHDALFGFVLSFGGYAHKCFGLVYVTKDEGAGADARVAARLAAIVEGTLKKMRFESELAPEIDHTPEETPDVGAPLPPAP